MTAKLASVIGVFEGVIGHRDTARRAGDSLATASAGHEIIVATSVNKKDRLVSFLLDLYQLFAKQIPKG
jgi:hypothetical protein